MDSPVSSRINFLDHEGRPIDCPTEWTPAYIDIAVPVERWDTVRITRHDESLPIAVRRVNGKARILAEWPRSGCGHYQVLLTSADEHEEKFFTIVSQKMSSDAYAHMVHDLEARLPAAVALGLQRMGALTGIKLLPPDGVMLAEELARLRRAIEGTALRPGLAQVLVALGQDPHQILETAEVWAARDRTRRPRPAQLVRTLARLHHTDSGHPQRVLDTRVERTADVYENRLVKAFYREVELRLRRILRAVTQPEIVAEAEKLLTQLLLARRQATFLDNVNLPAYLPTSLTMVLLKRQPYHAALAGYLEFHRSAGVRLVEPALEAPLENLPYLYQLWGTLEVLSVLLDVADEFGYCVEQQRLVGRDTSGIFIRALPDGHPAVVLTHPTNGTCVRLIPERTYSRRGDLFSISYQQRPDVVIEVQPVVGPIQIYLFDPKYKLTGETIGSEVDNGGSLVEGESDASQPKKVDIDKMHAYRDAIRDTSGRRAVEYAAILYPGKTVTYSSGLEALRAYPGEEVAVEYRLRAILTAAFTVSRLSTPAAPSDSSTQRDSVEEMLASGYRETV